ncbi:MAG: hypothetical protein KGI41_02755, partial [Patescibacteria group bacterium]|nr:hypothetical protein [Patescibacteria group bacterium]
MDPQDVRAFAQLSCRLMMDDAPQVGDNPSLEALYMHGLSAGMIASCDLFELADMVNCGYDRELFVMYNGDPASHATTVGWAGAETYRGEFLSRLVPETKLLPTAPGLHTRSETDGLVELAKEKGFANVGIITVPYHWPRVMSCLVGSMAKHDYRLRCWFVRPAYVNWHQPMVGSQG